MLRIQGVVVGAIVCVGRTFWNLKGYFYNRYPLYCGISVLQIDISIYIFKGIHSFY